MIILLDILILIRAKQIKISMVQNKKAPNNIRGLQTKFNL